MKGEETMKKAICVLLVALLALSAVGYAGESGEEEVAFADPVLENIMRKLVGNPEGALTVEALAEVQTLEYFADGDNTPEEEKIHNLSGLEHCVNLFKLSIPGNAVGDISPLSGLTGIAYLDLGGNPISDISALSNLRGLSELSIWYTGAKDLSPLSGCEQLAMLDAKGNGIEDVSALSGLSQLARLDLCQNEIRDASPLAGLSNLTALFLGENPVDDWSALSAIYPNLSECDFSPDQMPDGTVIAFDDPVLEAKIREAIGKPEGDVTYGDAKSYRGDLYANYNWQPGEEKIHSIEVLRYFTNIFKFEAADQDIRDLSPLSELKNLGILWISGSPISDLLPISGLENLGILQISDTGEALDLAPLAGLKNLGTLLASNDRIEDISALAGLSNLDVLDLSGNNISDLSALSGLAKLTSLKLAGNPVTDFEPIRELMPNITDRDFEPLYGDEASDTPIEIAEPAFEAALRRAMNIYDRPITERDAYLTRSLWLCNEKTEESMFSDISPLKYFVNLESLEFNSNPITDLSALAGLTKLKSLKAGFLQVGDLTPLAGLVNLEYLNVGFCPVGDFTPLAGLTKLRMIDADSCQVSDLTPLSSLTSLDNLILKHNPITDVAPLANLTNLKNLLLEGCPVADYSPLAGIYPNLEVKDFEVTDEAIRAVPPAQSNDIPSAEHNEPEQKGNTSDSASIIEGWQYDESTCTLTIDSDAAMIPYLPDQENAESATQTNAPWAANLAQIENIIVGDDVTLISDYAFAYASALKKITIGKGVSTLGFRCLYRCGNWGAGEDLEIIVNCAVMPALGEDVMGYTWDNPHTSLIVPVSQLDQWRAALGGTGLRILEKDFSLDGQLAAKQAVDGTPETIPYKELKKGDRGDEVKRMQRELIQLGFLDGKADGVFGEQTAQAVLRFKKANDIQPENSDATLETLARLYSGQADAS